MVYEKIKHTHTFHFFCLPLHWAKLLLLLFCFWTPLSPLGLPQPVAQKHWKIHPAEAASVALSDAGARELY